MPHSNKKGASKRQQDQLSFNEVAGPQPVRGLNPI